MNLCPCCAFARSACDIEGLEDFETRRLPTWLRERLLKLWPFVLKKESDDWDLVEYVFEKRNECVVIGWGQATMAGQSVFVFGTDLSFDLIELANEVRCGFLRVEHDDSIIYADGEATVILTEHPVRRLTADVSIQPVVDELTRIDCAASADLPAGSPAQLLCQ
jgi:hypothetical protein